MRALLLPLSLPLQKPQLRPESLLCSYVALLRAGVAPATAIEEAMLRWDAWEQVRQPGLA